MRRAASLLVLLAAAAAQYSAEQRQDFERTRQELLARDPLAAKLKSRRAAALERPGQPPPQGVLPPLDEARRAEACRLGYTNI